MMYKARFACFLAGALLCGGFAFSQNDDIEITDSTSVDWGGGAGGGITPNIPDEPVTSLTLSQSSLTLEGGESVRLVATVNPRAKNKNIIWTSADTDIADVKEDGNVTGMRMGKTVITATAAGNTTLSRQCVVTVTSDISAATGYIIPWGRDEAWQARYQQVEYSMDPGDTGWTMPDYDDSNWPTLTGPMGNEGNHGGGRFMHNYEWEGDYNGYNLRCSFLLPSKAPNTTYTFSAIHDDDLWIYLNGEQIGSFAGWSQWNERSLTIPSDKLIRGRNVLALRIMEGAGDQYLDFALHQKVSLTARYNVVLPDVPFEFFYDARNYDPDEHCIPNHKEANLKGTMLQLTENLPAIIEEGKALRISDRCEGYLDRWDKWSNESGAHFFRQGQDCMTIVAKVAPRQTSNASDFISNRGANYNYMWRIGSDYNISFLHTGTAYANDRALFLHSEEPQVLAVRVDGANDYILLQNLTTKEQLRIDGVNWGGGDNVFKVFYNDGGEFYLGDFYWVYYTFELLTDDQLALFGTSDFEDGISAPQRQASADSIYDICGRKVAAPVGGGIYIIEGRKILIR